MRGSDFYGIQEIFYRYSGGRSHSYFPFAVQHGWQIKATSFEAIDNPLEIWVWSERIKSEMSSHYPVEKIRVVGSPYLYLPDISEHSQRCSTSAIYVLPHSSHFAKIGFSIVEMKALVMNLKQRHGSLSILAYYLDVNSDICRELRLLGIPVLICGGLWSKYFMHNFRKIVKSHSKVYYSNFGSAVLFAQYENIPVEQIPLVSSITKSTNIYVNDLQKEFEEKLFTEHADSLSELGVSFKLDTKECEDLIAQGLAKTPFSRAFKKILANQKNTVFDYLLNLRPALIAAKRID